MPRLALLALVLALVLSVAAQSDVASACSMASSTAKIELFSCPCPNGNQGELEVPIYVVSGMMSIFNMRATPTLASLVVELQAPVNFVYRTVARLVLNEAGTTFADTCKGGFTSGPVDGRIVLVDHDGNELSFAQVKQLPLGTAMLSYIATFAGAVPHLVPGRRVRVKTYTTVIGADSTLTCTVDANGDGTNDLKVKTLTFSKLLRVPTTATLLTP